MYDFTYMWDIEKKRQQPSKKVNEQTKLNKNTHLDTECLPERKGVRRTKWVKAKDRN